MRIALCIVALAIIALGCSLIAASFIDPAPASAAPETLIAAPQHAVSPAILGVAMLAGGVIFLVLIFRRR